MRKEVYWKGKLMTIADIARLEGVSQWTLYDRMRIQGMTIEQAVSASHGNDKKGKERKPWSQMRPSEISRIKERKCRRCVYAAGTKLTGEGYTSIICDYIGYTGRMRGCDPRDCEFWRDEKPRGKRQSDW